MQLADAFSVPSSNHLMSILPGANDVFFTTLYGLIQSGFDYEASRNAAFLRKGLVQRADLLENVENRALNTVISSTTFSFRRSRRISTSCSKNTICE